MFHYFLRFSAIAVISLASGLAERALAQDNEGGSGLGGSLQCQDIRKGDREACQKLFEATCKEERYACQSAIVKRMDECRTDAFKQAEAAAEVFGKEWADSDRSSKFDRAEFEPPSKADPQKWQEGWINRANHIEAAVAKFVPAYEKWTVCSDHYDREWFGPIKEKLSGAYQANFRKFVDGEIEGKDLDRLDNLANALAANKKLDPKYRYKEEEIKTILASAKKEGADKNRRAAAATAAARCPAGPALASPFATAARESVDSDPDVKRRIVRQTGKRYTTRQGRISVENIDATMCTERRNPPHCYWNRVRVYREKPPGGEWTSWQAFTSEDDNPFNCQKF